MTYRFRSRVVLLIGAFLLAISLQPARADFGDCTSSTYMGRFPDAASGVELNCI